MRLSGYWVKLPINIRYKSLGNKSLLRALFIKLNRLLAYLLIAWEIAGKAVILQLKTISMETKVVHLHLKTDISSIKDWYFGSLKAIYDRFDEADIGIKYKSLTNAIRGKSEYENKHISIRIGVIQRKKKNI